VAIEIQIQSSALAKAISRATQADLYRTCLPTIGNMFGDHMDVFVDHLDVVENGITVVDNPDPDVRILVPIDVYLVPQVSLVQAAPGDDPPGAKTPAGRAVANYSLSLAGTLLSISLVDPALRLEPPNPQLEPLLEMVETFIPDLPDLDLAPFLAALRLPTPTSSQIQILASLVVIRFDPAGPATPHLFPGQEWGLFVDGAGVVDLVRSLLPPPLGARAALNWDPAGGVPRVSGRFRGKIPLPDPFTATVEVPFTCNLGLVSPALPRIRATVNRGQPQIHADNIPGFLEAEFEDTVDGYIAKLVDPAVVGGTKIDDRSFFLERGLPPMRFGAAELRMSVLAADNTGMTLGGVVWPTYAEWSTLSTTVVQFGLPSWFGTCRTTVGNKPPKTNVDCYGGVDFSNFGAYCGVIMTDPGGIAASFLTQPSSAVDSGGAESVGFSIPAIVAKGIDQDVTFLLRSARGVRLINLGRPIVKVDEHGNVEFTPIFIDDCLKLTNDDLSVLDWLEGKGKIPKDLIDPPFEHPDWRALILAERGLEVQLVSFVGLTPGELLSFRSPDHAIDVTADGAGQATVPVLFPLSEDASMMTLTRINRESLAGKFRVRSAAFVRRSVLASGEVNRLDSDDDGSVQLTRSLGDRWTRHAFGIGGMMASCEIATGEGEVALNPQPLPPEPPEAFLTAASRLPGLDTVILIPGFEAEPLAVARMKDGNAVLLQDDGSGSVRVSGSFTGPIGAMATAGDWSMSATQDQIAMFEVKRTT